MRIKVFVFIVLVGTLALVSLVKTYLVFEYKRNFSYLSELEQKIQNYKNEQSKLNVEILIIETQIYSFKNVNPDSLDSNLS
ncbi:MAG: hypothetical protein CBE45_001415 [Thiotrichales bacterium TMED285]|nr:MAG: hypothetical protein CBE45_001415 [Thiotrichales bacterium TMED285]